MSLNSRHRKTLESVFAVPVRSDVAWADVEVLFRAMGAELSEGRGSRVRVQLGEVRAVFHRPHPQGEIGKAALRSVRRFLAEAGVQPEE